MALVTAETIPAQQLSAAAQGLRRTIYDLYERNQTAKALDDTAFTAYTGVASGSRALVRDRIDGLWTVANNDSGAPVTGLWGRVYEVKVKNVALIDASATGEPRAFLQLHMALRSQLASIASFAELIRDQIDSSQQAVVTSLFGPSGADITTLIDRLEHVTEFATNKNGTVLAGKGGRVYELLYETITP